MITKDNYKLLSKLANSTFVKIVDNEQTIFSDGNSWPLSVVISIVYDSESSITVPVIPDEMHSFLKSTDITSSNDLIAWVNSFNVIQ